MAEFPAEVAEAAPQGVVNFPGLYTMAASPVEHDITGIKEALQRLPACGIGCVEGRL